MKHLRLNLATWINALLNPTSLARLKVRKMLTSPSRVLMLGFLFVIGVGTFLLCLPAASNGEPLSVVDALFTATSSTCVTGLTVIDVGKELTLFGQVVLLVLIQVGGLGFMTFGTVVLVLFGRRITLSERLVISNSLGEEGLQGMVQLVLRIVVIALSIEGLGAVLLLTRMIPRHGVVEGIWYSIFHAVSAFCNAGFDLAGGFSMYMNDPVVLTIIMVLIVLGGIGFTVMFDLQKSGYRFQRLMLHSKVVLVVTGLLLVVGFVMFLVLEWNNPRTLGNPSMHVMMRPVNAMFQSVTVRTAGFDTIAQGALTSPSLVLTLILMFIGASPASTGGGLKTTTFGVFMLMIVNVLRGRERIVVFRRTLSQQLLNRAVVLFTLALILIILSHTALSLLMKPSDVVTASNILYEVISAFGTVGLTIGVTAEMNAGAKIVTSIIMFIGRVGLMTIAFGLTRRHPKGQNHLDYPEGKIMIG